MQRAVEERCRAVNSFTSTAILLHSSASSSLYDFSTGKPKLINAAAETEREIRGIDSSVFLGLEPHLTVIDVGLPSHSQSLSCSENYIVFIYGHICAYVMLHLAPSCEMNE